MSQPSQPSHVYCRVDSCPIVELHEAHDIEHQRYRKSFDRSASYEKFRERASEMSLSDKSYMMEDWYRQIYGIRRVEPEKRSKSRSKRPPWRRPAPLVLDEIIVESTSPYVPKQFQELYRDVLDNYGELAPSKHASVRQMYWHLSSLIEVGKIARVEVSKRLYVYLRAGSKLLSDFGFLHDFAHDQIPAAGNVYRQPLDLPRGHLRQLARSV